jgi:A/G-specific adenine glycosylase
VEKLASARESSVLAAWSGLGYYRRARMLHAAAKQIVRNYQGQFPCSAQELRELAGIGRYTAAAIASIAFAEPVAVVDGNVERVLGRLLGGELSGEALWKAASGLLDPGHPGDFNQAMMELGATVCLPRAPLCLDCPISKHCRTRGDLGIDGRKPRQRKRQVCYVLSQRDDSVLLVKRGKGEPLMASMWELPQARMDGAQPIFRMRHSITITEYTVLVVAAAADHAGGQWVRLRRLPTLPLTGLARKILTRAGLVAKS